MKSKLKVLKVSEYLQEVIGTSVKLEVKVFQIPEMLERELSKMNLHLEIKY